MTSSHMIQTSWRGRRTNCQSPAPSHSWAPRHGPFASRLDRKELWTGFFYVDYCQYIDIYSAKMCCWLRVRHLHGLRGERKDLVASRCAGTTNSKQPTCLLTKTRKGFSPVQSCHLICGPPVVNHRLHPAHHTANLQACRDLYTDRRLWLQ